MLVLLLVAITLVLAHEPLDDSIIDRSDPSLLGRPGHGRVTKAHCREQILHRSPTKKTIARWHRYQETAHKEYLELQNVSAAKNTIKLHTDEPHTILFIRHGQSMANLAHVDDLPVSDYRYFDPDLSDLGCQQAAETGRVLKQFVPPFQPEIIIASPLKRTRRTAEIVFPEYMIDNVTYVDGVQVQNPRIPRIIDFNARECLSDSDDIGHLKNTLANDYPIWNWTTLPEGYWWYIPQEIIEKNNVTQETQLDPLWNLWVDNYKYSPEKERYKKIIPWEEPDSSIEPRAHAFVGTLLDYPQHKKVAVVTHGDFIEWLMGKEVDPFLTPKQRKQKPNVPNCGIVPLYLVLWDEHDTPLGSK